MKKKTSEQLRKTVFSHYKDTHEYNILLVLLISLGTLAGGYIGELLYIQYIEQHFPYPTVGSILRGLCNLTLIILGIQLLKAFGRYSKRSLKHYFSLHLTNFDRTKAGNAHYIHACWKQVHKNRLSSADSADNENYEQMFNEAERPIVTEI